MGVAAEQRNGVVEGVRGRWVVVVKQGLERETRRSAVGRGATGTLAGGRAATRTPRASRDRPESGAAETGPRRVRMRVRLRACARTTPSAPCCSHSRCLLTVSGKSKSERPLAEKRGATGSDAQRSGAAAQSYSVLSSQCTQAHGSIECCSETRTRVTCTPAITIQRHSAYPHCISTWQCWASRHPEARSLSRRHGFEKSSLRRHASHSAGCIASPQVTGAPHASS